MGRNSTQKSTETQNTQNREQNKKTNIKQLEHNNEQKTYR